MLRAPGVLRKYVATYYLAKRRGQEHNGLSITYGALHGLSLVLGTLAEVGVLLGAV